MIVEVKELIDKEYNLIRKGQIIFTYFHFVSSEALTKAMIASESMCILPKLLKIKKVVCHY